MGRRYRLERTCGNPRCGDQLAAFTRIRLCPSCRLASGAGAGLAFVLAFLPELLRTLWELVH